MVPIALLLLLLLPLTAVGTDSSAAVISLDASAGSFLEVFPFVGCQTFGCFVNIQNVLPGSDLANQFLRLLGQVMFGFVVVSRLNRFVQ